MSIRDIILNQIMPVNILFVNLAIQIGGARLFRNVPCFNSLEMSLLSSSSGVAPCPSGPFTSCHSERGEESRLAQGKLREESRPR